MSKIKLCKSCGKEVTKSSKTCPYCGAKLKGSKLKFILGGIVALIIAIIVIAFSEGNSGSNNDINLVKNGHLGDYKTVTVSKVLETNFKNADIKWDSFQSKGKNIVEATVKDTSLNKNLLIQFSLNSNGTFEVVHVDINGQAFETPYDVKLFLDGLYENYAQLTSDKSIVVDTNTSNNTLGGNNQNNSQSTSEPKNQTATSNNANGKTQETKKAIELLSYIGVSIDNIKKDLGNPNKIDGAQSSELYDYGTFYFVIDNNKATSIGLKGSGATANNISVGMFPKDIKNQIGNPAKESFSNGYSMEYRFNNDSISIQYTSDDSNSAVKQITITDLNSASVQ